MFISLLLFACAIVVNNKNYSVYESIGSDNTGNRSSSSFCTSDIGRSSETELDNTEDQNGSNRQKFSFSSCYIPIYVSVLIWLYLTCIENIQRNRIVHKVESSTFKSIFQVCLNYFVGFLFEKITVSSFRILILVHFYFICCLLIH
jgi:hypothetical protein